MKPRCRRFTPAQARRAARVLGVRFGRERFTLRSFHQGMLIEREHSDIGGCDPILAGRIALAHLREHADYYKRLARYVERHR